ncbi:MAG: ribosomal protein S18-alanine N-acetyltransferase [Aeromicrobium sp.]|uniref:ribosomal protein S18-alanine N-acetyltransferase n=1 Tax=Aeromicrobium sp. TaxID=1871063 RepID=UPI0039E686BA
MTPVTRPVTAADLPALVAVEQAGFAPAQAWNESQLRAELDLPDRIVRVSETDGAVTGYATCSVLADTADLLRIAVDPSARRHGHARGLLADLAQAAADEGAERLMLEVAADNDAALAFYRAAGLTPIHRRRRYYPGGVDAIILTRELP